MPKLSLREVQAILQAERSDALGAQEASELSKQRSKAMEYYLGDVSLDGDMPPPVDRSKAVSFDVADTVEGLMPSMMEIFASGDDVVEFEPVGPEDEEAAQQETDYVNHVFWQKNHGFLTLYSFIKDALLQKNGIVKVWWEEKEAGEEEETYTGLSDDVYAQLVAGIQSDRLLTIQKHESYPDPASEGMQPQMGPNGMPVPPPMLHDVTLGKRVFPPGVYVPDGLKYGCAMVEPVAPEDFGITRRARSVHVSKADYCYHDTRTTQAALIAEGYDPLQVESLPSAGDEDTEESQSRDTVDDNDDIATASANKATRTIRTTEHYATLDYEGNGKACLYKIRTGYGTNEILRKKKGPEGKYEPDMEKVDVIPFAAMTPIIMTHRFYGRSMADIVMDLQRINTALLRSLLDNIYLANNQRMEVAEEYAGDKTLDDLLTNRPGGFVRTKRPGGLAVIQNQDITGAIYPALEYNDARREWRTGVTRQGQGIDAKALGDQSATQAAQLFTMSQARMRLIARIFAETGVRDLFLLLHGIIRKHGSGQQDTIRLRNKWVTIDPRNFKTRADMTVNVGIAAGSKDQQIMFLMNILGIQEKAVAMPQAGLAKPGNIYNTLKRIVHLANLKSVEPFFTDPDETDEQGNPVNIGEPPPDPKVAEAQAKAEAAKEIEAIKAEAKVASEQQKAQMMGQVEEIKLQYKAREAELNAQVQAAKERAQAEADIIVERERTRSEERLAGMQRAFDAQQAQLDRLHEVHLEFIRQRGQQASQERQIASDDNRAREDRAAQENASA